MCDTNLADLLRAQNTYVYVSSHLIHSQHGSGAVIVASRESATATKSRNTGVEWGAEGDAGVKTVKRKRAMQSNSDCSQSSIKRGQPLWIRELSTAGSTAFQQTMSTPEEQMTMANQQLNVQLQQFLETLETILPTARIELEEQVQSATSTTTHKGPMIRADRLFKLRSYLGAVDQRNELELTITEEALTTRLITPRLIRELRMLMYYTLVMMKTLYRCRYAGW